MKKLLLSISVLFATSAQASQCVFVDEEGYDTDLARELVYQPSKDVVKSFESQSSLVQDLIIAGITDHSFEDELNGNVALKDILTIPDIGGEDLYVFKMTDGKLDGRNIYRVELGRGDNAMVSYYEVKGTTTVGTRTVNTFLLVGLLSDGSASYCRF